MANPKGNPNPNIGKTKGRGRPKGSKDKVQRTVKESVLKVWASMEKKGHGLEKWATNNQDDFYKYFIRSMLPKEIDAKHTGVIEHKHSISLEVKNKLDEIYK